jgi:hypothetical protein
MMEKLISGNSFKIPRTFKKRNMTPVLMEMLIGGNITIHQAT